jgi:hypothetical protein
MLLVPGHKNGSVLRTTAKQGVHANAVFPSDAVSPSTGNSSGKTREDVERSGAKSSSYGRMRGKVAIQFYGAPQMKRPT